MTNIPAVHPSDWLRPAAAKHIPIITLNPAKAYKVVFLEVLLTLWGWSGDLFESNGFPSSTLGKFSSFTAATSSETYATYSIDSSDEMTIYTFSINRVQYQKVSGWL